jgi:hypothetical protein
MIDNKHYVRWLSKAKISILQANLKKLIDLKIIKIKARKINSPRVGAVILSRKTKKIKLSIEYRIRCDIE